MVQDHHPPAGSITGNGVFLLLRLATGSDRRDVVIPRSGLATLLLLLALVGTQRRWDLVSGLQSYPHHGLQGLGQELPVMAMASCPDYRQGKALAVGHQTALRPTLAPVRGMGAGGLPPTGALVSAPSPRCQVPSQPCRSSSTAKTAAHTWANTPAFTPWAHSSSTGRGGPTRSRGQAGHGIPVRRTETIPAVMRRRCTGHGSLPSPSGGEGRLPCAAIRHQAAPRTVVSFRTRGAWTSSLADTFTLGRPVYTTTQQCLGLV